MNDPIAAVREFRGEFGCGLREAKAMWDKHKDLDKMRAAMRTGGLVEDDYLRALRLERELARYKRLEAILRDRSDINGNGGPNEAMSILTEWEGPK